MALFSVRFIRLKKKLNSRPKDTYVVFKRYPSVFAGLTEDRLSRLSTVCRIYGVLAFIPFIKYSKCWFPLGAICGRSLSPLRAHEILPKTPKLCHGSESAKQSTGTKYFDKCKKVVGVCLCFSWPLYRGHRDLHLYSPPRNQRLEYFL
jgi:hypothetical protein